MLKRLLPLLIFLLFISSALFLGVILGQRQVVRIGSQSFTNEKVGYTMALINSMYVDPVNMDSLAEKALPLILEELDPHSVYMPASELGEANEALEGEFDGIGIVFNMATDTVIVLNVISGGPSEKAGVRNGDRIIKINDSLVAGVKTPQNDIVKKLRGKRGTKVNLALQRQDINDLVPITVVRDKIPIKSLNVCYMYDEQTGVIKLSTFSRNSFSEASKAIEELKEKGMKKLIFDLRDNAGGFLDQAILIANEFLPLGSTIVYTKDRAGRQTKEFSDSKGKSKQLELVMLINEASASSSEILAGAIQDNDRGTIIGRRSYGKGLVQQQFPYGDGSAVRLTIARYYTPTGRSIQKPYDKGLDAYKRDLINRYDHKEFFTADSIQFADSLKFTTPKGKTVYGGGGIMPDVFVPLDTTGVNQYFTQVSGRNVLYKYTLKYSDKHRASLNKIKTVDQLRDFFSDDEKLFKDFTLYASKQGISATAEQLNEAKQLITTQIKAHIARNTPLSDTGFYVMLLPVDTIMQSALKHLE